MNEGKISLSDALKVMDERERNGKPLPFAIKFVERNGAFVDLKNCVRVGLRQDLHDKGYIGIRILKSAEHVIPAHIRTITKFNGKQIFLG